MNKKFDLKYTIIWLAIALIIGSLVSLLSGLPVWACFLIVAVAMVLNGFIAEYEDDLPGGFNNPMSEEEIKNENQRRKKRLLPVRIGIWVIFCLILIGFVWLYIKKGI